MAIVASNLYSGRVVTGDSGYPLGKAQDIVNGEKGTGTPLRASWVNDQWGFLQALLDAADITPSGTPDQVGQSDYLDAVNKLIREPLALKIFQSPSSEGLTEIQTRTVNGGEVYEVRKTSDDSLANIYSDSAGVNEIAQNGVDNVSDSGGVVEFYITDGDYYVEVGAASSKFTTGFGVTEYVTDLSKAKISIPINCKSHSPNNGGVGGTYIYDESISKSEHDGVKFVSPTVPYTDLSSYLKGAGETDPSGTGVWVCKSLPSKKPQVSFVIDDGLEVQYDDVPPVFEAYGLRCAFGVIPELTANGTGRFSKSEVQDLNSRGYEIIAHSITDLRTTTSKALSQAELNTAYQELSQYAKVNAYLASQSQLSATAVEAGKELYDYLFNLTAAQAEADIENALFDSDEYYRLSRVNIDGANSVLGIPAAQKAAINYKNVAIYEHLYTDVTALESILAEITQYKAINIGVPRDSFEKSITEKLPSPQDKSIVSIDLFTSSSGSINTASGSLPFQGDSLFFTPSAAGTNKVLQFERNIEAGKTYTFSCGLTKSSSASISSSFGIHFLDSGGSIISQNSVETDTAPIDSNDRRYFVTASAPSNAVEIRVFIRTETDAVASVTLSQPRLSVNKAILPDEELKQTTWLKQNLPAQDITVGRFNASYPTYNLVLSNEDNITYSISSNVISFKKDGVYSISIYGSGTAPAVTTGIIFASFVNQNASGRSIGFISGNDTQANFAGNTVVNVSAGDTMQVSIRAKSDQAADGVMSILFSGLSALEIQKVG